MAQEGNTENKQHPARKSELDAARESIKLALDKYGIPTEIKLVR